MNLKTPPPLGAAGRVRGGACICAEHCGREWHAHSKARVDALVAQLVQQGQQDTPQLQQAVREELINREILMQEAARRGIPTRPDVKAQLAVAQQTVVLRALIEDFVKNNPPTDAEIKARYDDLVKQTGGGKEYHLHHILVPDEAQAKDLIAQIKAGGISRTSRRNIRRIRDRARTAATWTGRARKPTCPNLARRLRS